MEKKEKTVGLTRTGMTGGKIMCIGCGSGRVFWQQLRLEDSSRLTVFCFKFKGFLLFLLLSLSLSLFLPFFLSLTKSASCCLFCRQGFCLMLISQEDVKGRRRKITIFNLKCTIQAMRSHCAITNGNAGIKSSIHL